MKPKHQDMLAIAVFFAAAYLSLNVLAKTLVTNILSVAFIISGTYGIICLSQKHPFMYTTKKLKL